MTSVPKTIVITMPRKSGAASTSGGHYTTSTVDMDRFGLLGDQQPRKRRRLTHLTPEERMMRRKLKNRVAAQTARDRKKARMSELESLVAELEDENQQLMNENKDLENKTLLLEQENDQLRERLGLGQNDVVVKEEPTTCESAALKVSQQQGRVLAHYLAATRCLTFLMTLSLMYSWGYSNNSKAPKSNPRPLPYTENRKQLAQPSSSPTLRWWGPQQNSWNPSMNS
ncbi:X-box-binding protein 1-like [Tubulanus polymorphus]|uniref:X-box-binding protein 1-like n=1 Tax=Tubulanus polymorphus TaxID=672921 RepID=UPI003DA39F02